MDEIMKFSSDKFGAIRASEINGEPYFVGNDIAKALGYANPRKALLDHVDEEDKDVTKCDTLGGAQNMTVINESGVYSLVFASKLPTAKEFKHWVTSEVLPSIRRHGAYMTPKTIEEAILNPDSMIKVLTALKDEQDKRKALEVEKEANRPKVIFADAVATSKTSILIGDLAKILRGNGIETGQKRLFRWMRDNGYLIKGNRSDANMPTQRAMEMGLFEIKESSYIDGSGANHITKTVKVTGKGQTYFVNKFLSRKEDAV
jgi:anti-repressor protein